MSNKSMIAEGRHPDEETLSAYWDRELAPADRSRVEAHLTHCEQCRRVLRGYERLSRALRDDPVAAAVPARLDHELRARLNARARPSHWALLPAVGSLAAAALLLVFGSTLIAPGAPAPLASAYPARNATSVALTAAVEIPYPPGVDKVTVEQAVDIEPPVKVRKEWRGDTLVLTPEEPLEPATTYLVTSPRVEPKGAAPVLPVVVLPQPTPQPAATAVVTTFTTASVAVAQAPVLPERSPEPQPRASSPAPAVLSSAVTPTPVAYSASPVAIAVLPPQSSATPVSVTSALAAAPQEGPLRDMTSLLGQPQVLVADLGEDSGTARLVRMSEQPFEGGRLLSREDERSVIALYATGRWESFADTYVEGDDDTPPATTPAPSAASPEVTPAVATVAPLPPATPTGQKPKAVELKRGLGKVWNEQPDVRKNLESAVGTERSFTGAVKPFANGLVIATDRRSAYVLYKNRRWQELAFFGTVATPVRRATTAPVTAAPEATGAPAGTAPRAAPTPGAGAWTDVMQEPTACPANAASGFRFVYADPLVKARLGCPSEPDQPVQLAEQTFERGRMLWRADTGTTYVLTAAGNVALFADVNGDDKLPSDSVASAGITTPDSGIGHVWQAEQAVRQALVRKTADERSFAGTVQEYAGGTIFLIDGEECLVMFADGRWERHPILRGE